MSDVSADELRRLVQAKSAALAESAVKSGGQVPSAEIQELDRLVRLIDLQSKVEPANAAARVAAAGAAGGNAGRCQPSAVRAGE